MNGGNGNIPANPGDIADQAISGPEILQVVLTKIAGTPREQQTEYQRTVAVAVYDTLNRLITKDNEKRGEKAMDNSAALDLMWENLSKNGDFLISEGYSGLRQDDPFMKSAETIFNGNKEQFFEDGTAAEIANQLGDNLVDDMRQNIDMWREQNLSNEGKKKYDNRPQQMKGDISEAPYYNPEEKTWVERIDANRQWREQQIREGRIPGADPNHIGLSEEAIKRDIEERRKRNKDMYEAAIRQQAEWAKEQPKDPRLDFKPVDSVDPMDPAKVTESKTRKDRERKPGRYVNTHW